MSTKTEKETKRITLTIDDQQVTVETGASALEAVNLDRKLKFTLQMSYLPIEARVKNLKEIDLGYTEETAVREARWCLRCDLGTEDGTNALERMRKEKQLKSKPIDATHNAAKRSKFCGIERGIRL